MTEQNADKSSQAAELVKKPELLERIVERSGHPKRDVKPIVEATLDVIVDALIAGETLNVPPIGRLRPIKNKPIGEGVDVLTVKLRTAKNRVTGNAEKDVHDSED